MFASLEIGTVQTIRKFAIWALLLIAAPVVFFSGTPWNHLVHHGIETLGLFLIVVCILGRTWCSVYIVDRKNRELVSRGPSSVCRNPLYHFSLVGAAGIGALTGSLVLALAGAIATAFVFYLVVLREERLLLSLHGDEYERYLFRVPRFLPKFSLYINGFVSNVNLTGVFRTFADACIFLVALPIIELLEYAKGIGVIQIVFKIP